MIVGERVLLRYPRRADQTEYSDLRRRSQAFLKPWEPALPAGVDPYGPTVFASYLRGRRTKRRVRLLVCRVEDRVILGGININEIVHGAFQSAYLGYWVGQPFARQGYTSEALTLVVNHALHRLEANIRPENTASIALVKRIGFRNEGFSPNYLEIDGAWRDHERWAVTREDWPDISRTEAATGS